ncbi:MAG: assimilatory sulfite reductase (NADPH) flavoprotein subunit [Lysobacterales bacterium]
MSAQLQAPTTPLLSEAQQQLLVRLTEGLAPAALHFISGYTAGLAAAATPARPLIAAAPAAATGNTHAITVLYGSQTGNARREAERIHAELAANGIEARLLRADAYPLRELASERTLLLVISTQGEGEPPDDARGLVEHLQSRRAPKLPGLRFAVLGLGDSSYAEFNAVARRLDQRLRALGAEALLPLAEADTDIDTVAAPWREQALSSARRLAASATPRSTQPVPASTSAIATDTSQNFAAEVLQNQRITARDSDQDIRHLELSLAGSGIDYQPGDALGIRPRNDPALIERVLDRLALSGSESVRRGDEIRSLHDWLIGHRELTRLHPGFLRSLAERAPSPALTALLAPGAGEKLSNWMASRQLDDVLREFPADWTAADLVAALRPLAPRLYSIASSRKAVGEEAHLTVAVFEQPGVEATQRGVASGFLAAAVEGATVPVYLHRNERFRLPADDSRDLIMIGPGTGLAPFRGFVQERAAEAARGRNWLLFGARHQRSQFLYQLEWQAALRAGELHRLDLAFSRDQAERIHVTQRLREHGREVYAWLEGGAHLYVCGAIAMGRSVHAALRDLLIEHGGRDDEAADAYLAGLQQAGRYARDVY